VIERCGAHLGTIGKVFGDLFLMLTLVGCVLMLFANLAWLSQLFNYVRLRRAGLAREHEQLAHPLPETDLPHVVLQIPSFNEGAMVERAIANAMNLDWPKDRLHVQICDDSTDDTTEIARAAAARAVAQGFDVAVFHRDDRQGFKAGSLQAALKQTSHEYFVILDVDYVSPPDFVRRCMAVLLSDPNLAFVQARPDHLNARTNILTRAQALMLDYHYAVEQARRSWSGEVVPFNGTCGVWRRKAIELGGGWRGETLSEDWELSYHTSLKGMRGVVITTVTAAGELPRDLRSWVPQQKRWAKGMGQVSWQMLPRVFGDHGLSSQERFAAIAPLLQWFFATVFTATYLLAIPAMVLNPSHALLLGLTVYSGLLTTWSVILAMMWVANRATGRGLTLWRFLLDVWPVPYLIMYVSWLQFWSVPAIIMGRKAIFVRTPKRGSSALVS